MKYLILVLFVGFGLELAAQCTVLEPPSVTQMMKKYEEANRSSDEIQAWRIQVVATTDRRLMESTRSKFRTYFPGLKCTWSHKAPYYQVQAGAFATKQEALPEIGRVKDKFPKAYLVVDRIKYDELNRQL